MLQSENLYDAVIVPLGLTAGKWPAEFLRGGRGGKGAGERGNRH